MKTNKFPKGIKLWFPSEILNDDRLSASQAMSIAAIIFLDNKDGCFASNSVLAHVAKCTAATLSKNIQYLCKLGYIVENISTGRTNIRRVRPDLKKYKSDISIEDSRSSKKEALTSEELTHKYIVKEEEKEYREVIINESDEKELVSKNFNSGFRNNWDYYLLFKDEFEKRYHLKWDKKSVLDLITLCNSLFLSYKKQAEQIIHSHRKAYLLKIFEIIISNRPHFFRDTKPETFNRYWNAIVLDVKIDGKINRISYEF